MVKWAQLATAMPNAECFGQRVSGSVVSFTMPRSRAINGNGDRIVFHKLHLEQEIDQVRLLSMGKRLRKWFGWDSEVFVERERGTDPGSACSTR